MNKTIVITGASAGIGKETAKYFAEKGWKVAATMRKPEKEAELSDIENVTLYKLDVTDKKSIESATAKIIDDFGKVDVVLNNAGYGLLGTFEIATDEQVRYQYEVNVFGLFDVTRAFLPHFRSNNSGMFINISSVGGKLCFPYMSLYHSSKFAIEGFSETIYYELAEFGIKVKIVEPGAVATDFGGRSLVVTSSETNKAYDKGFNTAFFEKFPTVVDTPAPPINTAKIIYEAATDGTTKLRYVSGGDANKLILEREKDGDEKFVQNMRERFSI